MIAIDYSLCVPLSPFAAPALDKFVRATESLFLICYHPLNPDPDCAIDQDGQIWTLIYADDRGSASVQLEASA